VNKLNLLADGLQGGVKNVGGSSKKIQYEKNRKEPEPGKSRRFSSNEASSQDDLDEKIGSSLMLSLFRAQQLPARHRPVGENVPTEEMGNKVPVLRAMAKS